MLLGLPLIALAVAAPVDAAPDNPTTTSRSSIEPPAREIGRFVDRIAAIDGSFPAAALVIATPDSVPLIRVIGTTKAGVPHPVSRHSRFYIASQTKAFVGTMAVRLDELGVLPLSTTLDQIWPGLKLPAPANASVITMRDLLSHQAPLSTTTLNFLTAYVRSIPAGEYPALLSREITSREPGFSYSNLGYLIYGAALEARIGRSWDYWLDRELLQPLGLGETVARTNRVAREQMVWSHSWTAQGWTVLAPKPDATRHSAGGLVSSAQDQARWIQANLGSGAPAAVKRAIAVAQRPVTAAKLADGDLVCDGYGLGWYSCSYQKEPFLLTTGEFVGTRSFTALFPRQRAGIGFVASSDSGIERLSLQMIRAFVELSKGDPAGQARLQRMALDYPETVKKIAAKRSDALKTARADPEWGGWAWSPSAAEQSALAGHYREPVFGSLRIDRDSNGLWLELGAYRARLQAAKPGLFAAWADGSITPETLTYEVQCDCVRFRERSFQRVSADR